MNNELNRMTIHHPVRHAKIHDDSCMSLKFLVSRTMRSTPLCIPKEGTEISNVDKDLKT